MAGPPPQSPHAHPTRKAQSSGRASPCRQAGENLGFPHVLNGFSHCGIHEDLRVSEGAALTITRTRTAPRRLGQCALRDGATERRRDDGAMARLDSDGPASRTGLAWQREAQWQADAQLEDFDVPCSNGATRTLRQHGGATAPTGRRRRRRDGITQQNLQCSKTCNAGFISNAENQK